MRISGGEALLASARVPRPATQRSSPANCPQLRLGWADGSVYQADAFQQLDLAPWTWSRAPSCLSMSLVREASLPPRACCALFGAFCSLKHYLSNSYHPACTT